MSIEYKNVRIDDSLLKDCDLKLFVPKSIQEYQILRDLITKQLKIHGLSFERFSILNRDTLSPLKPNSIITECKDFILRDFQSTGVIDFKFDLTFDPQGPLVDDFQKMHICVKFQIEIKDPGMSLFELFAQTDQ